MTTTDDLRFDDMRAVFDAPPDVAPATHPAECRRTRAALHDYVDGNLRPRHQRRLEKHLYGCDTCIRAFIDLREESWARRAVRHRKCL